MTREQQYIILVRLFLNDSPEANRLLRGYESSDQQIALAMQMVLSDWNTSDPTRRNFTYDNFPSLSLFIKGTVIYLLQMAGILNSRNRLNYNAGGLSVQLNDKGPEYMNWINMLKQDYETNKVMLLRRMNIAHALGGGAAGVISDFMLSSMSPILRMFA